MFCNWFFSLRFRCWSSVYVCEPFHSRAVQVAYFEGKTVWCTRCISLHTLARARLETVGDVCFCWPRKQRLLVAPFLCSNRGNYNQLQAAPKRCNVPVLLTKLTPCPSSKDVSSSAIREFPDILYNPKFITMLPRARHWSLSWARWIQSISRHPPSQRPCMIRLLYRASSWSVLSWLSPQNAACVPLLPMHATCLAHPILPFTGCLNCRLGLKQEWMLSLLSTFECLSFFYRFFTILLPGGVWWPPLWRSGQSSWLQIRRSRVRFPKLADFLRSTCSKSGTGSTQPREDNWAAGMEK
jgi:hypothetical protein